MPASKIQNPEPKPNPKTRIQVSESKYPAHMSIRQVRVSDKEQILKRLPESYDKNIQVVLKDGTVHALKLLNSKSDSILTENGRLKKITILLNDISEVYFDINV